MNRLLVANRAEIASRVFRTCRRLGIQTVAIHSDSDAGLPYVREADLAVRLPGDAPADTYLRADLIVEAARRAGADAVHPGYGFLSENAAFARAVIDAGLTWVGPAPESIEAMGSKIEAKAIMKAAGVPVLEAPEHPTEADLPLLVKASAGGGGRGMRVVRTLADLDTEVAKARAEAESAFGDGTVFVEPYVEEGRHVEVQVVGSTVYGERDCSLQRRHQKVVEETPAPDLPEETRAALHEAARRAAEAIDYRGAGTVEFLYDRASDRFWFLEMNTRLQVEHPVTELVHGVDLVELQLRAAEGLDTPSLVPREGYSTNDVAGRVASASERIETSPTGHAVEARLYAEDPAADYRPQSGTLTAFRFPAIEGVRIDAGYEAGSTVGTFYDAMLAKVIAHGAIREQAVRRLVAALRGARIHGLTTNRDQLLDVLTSEEFAGGRVSTALLASRGYHERAEQHVVPATARVAATIALAEATRRPGFPVAWRNVVSQPQRTEWVSTGSTNGGDGSATEVVAVEWYGGRDGYTVDGATVIAASPDRVTLEVDGVRTTYDVSIDGDRVDVDSPHGHTALRRVPRFVDPSEQQAPGSLLAPMPGTVVAVHAQAGDEVTQGQPLLVLEAMKMQHTVTAPATGVVTGIDAHLGAQVAAGQVLAVVEEK